MSVVERVGHWLGEWFRKIFRRRRPAELPPAPPAQLLLPPPPERLLLPRLRPARTRVRTPRREPAAPPRRNNYIKHHIGELLNGIEETFKSLTRGTHGHSSIHPETRVGLKRMGPIVIPKSWFGPDNGDWHPVIDPVIENPKQRWPALIFTAINEGGLSNDHGYWPDFLYALKINRKPFYLKAIGDIIYEAGLAYRINNTTLWWISFHVGINERTGVVKCARELVDLQIPVNNRARDHYNLHAWMVPHGDRHYGPERYQLIRLAHIFYETFVFWQCKSQFWSIGVRHDGRRCTFAVHPKNTSVYFRDRKRTALTAAGKLRPIIHHVRAHPRILPTGRETTVREHIRGLRLFNWKGYECAVTAPDFHKWVTDDFTLPGEDVSLLDGDSHLSLAQLGRALAEAEDQQDPAPMLDITSARRNHDAEHNTRTHP